MESSPSARTDQRRDTRARRVLPIGRSEIVAYLHHAYPLSIAAGASAHYSAWLFNNYVQLRCHSELVGASAVTEFDFYLLPNYFSRFGEFLRMPQVLPALLWSRREGVVPGVLSAVDNGYYVQVPADEFYIPCRAAFQKRHYIHELLVFGYDLPAATVDVLGFDASMEFGTQAVPFAQLEEAIAFSDLRDHYDPGGVRLYRHLEAEPYLADVRVVAEFLSDYLAARDTSERFRAMAAPKQGYLYGTAVYPALSAFYMGIAAAPDAMDMRPIQLVWEHKKCMLLRIARLEALGHGHATFAPRYARVVEHANSLRLLCLKYLLTGKADLLPRVSSGLEALVALERPILTDVLERIERTLRV